MTASPEALVRLRLAGQRSSASSIQSFAECSYRHLLQRGLNLRAWEEPERAYQIEGKDFGTLYHALAHRLFVELAEQKRLPLSEEALEPLFDRIAALVDEELERFADEGGIVNPALLGPVSVRLRNALEEMLRDEMGSTAADEGFVLETFEREFDFQTVCGPFRENRAERKSGDPRLAAFKRLREIP